MCAACVAQGVAYGGGALAALQVMAARSRHRRGGEQPAGDPSTDDRTDVPEDEPAPA
ncbi:MAG TPA: hypothetical protein VFB94_25750 [Acidimicrobiales bacterium]|nr:hypothetical protein [Acidimicrobiales bacterium]